MTQNISTAHPSKFRLVFPFLPFLGDDEKGDALLLYCSKVTLPDLSMEPDIIPNQFYDAKVPTRNLTYGDMEVTYTLDEKYTNYSLLFNWLMYLKHPEGFIVRNEPINATLMIYSNNDNPKFKFELKNIFPLALTGIDFDKTVNTTDDMEATVTFAMEYFLIEEIS